MRRLARDLLHSNGWQLKVVKRQQRAFKITGLTWIAERSFAWLGRNRRLTKDYEYRVQSFFMLITTQPCFVASSYSAWVKVPTFVSGSPSAGP